MTSGAEILYISAATNRNSQAADIAHSSLICFATQNLLSLWETSESNDVGVYETLQGHSAEVNCVKFMKDGNLIASGDQAGVLQIRTRTSSSSWRVVISEQAHNKKPITSLATYGDMVVTGSSDASVKIWRLEQHGGDGIEHTLRHIQTLSTQQKYPLDIKMVAFPGTPCLFLAIATTGRDVNIWTGTTQTQFTLSTSLSGHEDWVKSLAFTESSSFPPQLMLASGSQDNTIRLWTVDQIAPPHPNAAGGSIFDKFEASLSDLPEGEDGGRQMSSKRHIVGVKSSPDSFEYFSIVFDALLVGHEAGITALSWQFEKSDNPRLLSSSVDSSLIIWSATTLNSPEKTDSSSLWIGQQRFGDVGGQRFGGFTGSLWAQNGSEVLGWGWNGGWRRWRYVTGDDGNANKWNEVGAITGHQGVVKTIAWAPTGDYLLSTGLDQTTRIHGPCRVPSSSGGVGWREIARPQVHGYDVVGAEFLTPLQFVSIADEKVARVFEAPRNFVTMVNSLGTSQVPFKSESRPVGANVPPLGLSNKATHEDSELEMRAPSQGRCPFESELASATLWPETEKIFGHGYELVSVASSHSGSLVVTSCKSTTAEHAVLRVYGVEGWQLVGQPLAGHKLTVTRIVFSPNDDLLLSVSRDRTWRLFRRVSENTGFSPLSSCKAHERIIWDCAWIREPFDKPAFATASRDKTVKIWQPADDSLSNWNSIATLSFKEAVTAVDFGPVLLDGRRRLAVGLENGCIFLYSSQANNLHDWKLDMAMDSLLMHVSTVNRIAWRPSGDNKGPTQQLASCSDDGTIKVMMVHLGFN